MIPLRTRWALNGPWRLKDEPDLDNPMLPYTTPAFDDGNWRQVPPATHLQPWLYPDNPYWGPEIRAINDSAWWYRTQFALPDETQEQHVRLIFEAVDYYAEAWCNGHYLGQHEGNFAPFTFDVTDLVQAENTLTVKVTAPWDTVRRKGLTYVDQVHRGMVKGLYAHNDGLIPPDVNPIGIWRPVWVKAHAGLTIERIPFTVVKDEYDHAVQLALRLHVHNERQERFSGVLHIYLVGETFEGTRADVNYAVEVPPGRHVIEQKVRVPDPRWWWPWDMGYPDLYRLRCTLYDSDDHKLDVHEQVLGIRQIRLLRSRETMHYQINKVPFFVRGTTYMGELYLSQLTAERIEVDLDRIQECGLNLVRSHVHVAPPELYAACDRRGILIWQDFELNWVHDLTLDFEERAVRILHEMVDHLGNHPSIVTWSCHNEPTALPFEDRNLTQHPDSRLYRTIQTADPSRPAFICSGKQKEDWRRSGDTHAYIGGGHGRHYLDVYGKQSRLVTEFGCEAPPTLETLEETPLLAKRLAHTQKHVAKIQAYQAALLKYQIEWYRLARFEPCGGYIQFMFVDLYPQVGCGVLDAKRRPRTAYQALKLASQPVHVMLEYTPYCPKALWVVNDLARPLLRCLVEWKVQDDEGQVVTHGAAQEDIPAQRAHRVTLLTWNIDRTKSYQVWLCLTQKGQKLAENHYDDLFNFPPRPANYPWHFDPVLGMRCYGGPHAQSSLRILNTWYGRLATWLFPVYEWAERRLAGEFSPQLDAWLKKLFERVRL
jgi:beta-mannosidase